MSSAAAQNIYRYQPRNQEPWGQAFTYSLVGHACVAAFFLLSGGHKALENQIQLTEVKFIERPVLVEKPEQAAPQGGGGSSGGQGLLGSPGATAQVASHPEMSNPVPLSSPQGTARGEVVTAAPIIAPIVGVGNIGVVGRRKGSLAPLAGRTEGAPARGLASLPSGVVSAQGKGAAPIALSTEDIGSIQKKEAGMGLPLMGRGVLAESVKNNVPRGSVLSGESRKLSYESLKANPLEKQDWGQRKGPFSIEGPLKYRKILKMELPPYPRWAEEKAIEAAVSFRLWVDPRGKVKDNFYLEKTSGYSALDELAKESLRRFVFVPLPTDQPQDDEWGVATFRFELKK